MIAAIRYWQIAKWLTLVVVAGVVVGEMFR